MATTHNRDRNVYPTTGFGKLYFKSRRQKWDPYLTKYIKVNPKCTEDINLSCQIITLLIESKVKLSNIPFVNNFSLNSKSKG